MYTRNARVAASVGLHARPAAVFVRAVTLTGLPVTLAKPGHAPVDARSLLAVMSEDFACGDEVAVSVDPAAGTAADDDTVRAAVDHLAGLLATDLVDAR
ncbi:HPr family phosphocarrier protein [Specibacter cremeus]|uniref:HPr family phosphocarrier protein n=1 Tax=Specibacter cremeus TaxID=1629051 RepID=UPI000F7885F1|nr:HPr family phosphocarrier protein [Specibacter cremeus]